MPCVSKIAKWQFKVKSSYYTNNTEGKQQKRKIKDKQRNTNPYKELKMQTTAVKHEGGLKMCGVKQA